MTIGENIKKERKRQGLTQNQLGKKLGVSGAMIAAWENGKRNPKYPTIEKIADALEVAFLDLAPDKESLTLNIEGFLKESAEIGTLTINLLSFLGYDEFEYYMYEDGDYIIIAKNGIESLALTYNSCLDLGEDIVEYFDFKLQSMKKNGELNTEKVLNSYKDKKLIDKKD